ncbi:response regulator [Deinococcus yavapaiensis]|uniref:Response regulator receiver domain-containing protein n=1 Tax=Deinococcus yavapaiensis KR-236 TaxID=694435 RepID=A0A318SGB1_9DEIO|nr:response regulator [Deinococcus yavapaiensis]PYE53091.1 response regulator receiver domain-containing protein [Deinococcus yavapaiensis KR-236]
MTSVLVVDDEPQLLELLALILRSRGFEVFTATSGVQALDLVERLSPSVVVCDVLSAPLRGLDVERALASRPNPPGFVLIGAAFAPPNVPCLPKPFRPADLFALIESLVRVPRS